MQISAVPRGPGKELRRFIFLGLRRPQKLHSALQVCPEAQQETSKHIFCGCTAMG